MPKARIKSKLPIEIAAMRRRHHRSVRKTPDPRLSSGFKSSTNVGTGCSCHSTGNLEHIAGPGSFPPCLTSVSYGLSGRIRTCWQNKLNAHLFGEERVDVGFEDQWIDNSSMADRAPTLTVDKNGQRHFSQMAWINILLLRELSNAGESARIAVSISLP